MTQRAYVTTLEGQDVFAFTLSSGALRATVLNYGGIVQRLFVPTARGELDVVLGYDSVAGYQKNSSYFGALVGRYANRIARGQFVLCGKTYQLAQNDAANHLHGGLIGFDKKVLAVEDASPSSVTFAYVSPAGEENYPGTLQLHYTVALEDDTLAFSYRASTDAPTIVSLTNHSYFNLNGHSSGPIYDHVVTLAADTFTPVSEEHIPTGEIRAVYDPLDLRDGKAMGDALCAPLDDEQLRRGGGYDHNFIPRGTGLRTVGSVLAPHSGVTMRVASDAPGVQLYTGSFIAPHTGKDGAAYAPHSALCLETQNFPDAPNHKNFPSAVLLPGDVFASTTRYTFECKE